MTAPTQTPPPASPAPTPAQLAPTDPPITRPLRRIFGIASLLIGLSAILGIALSIADQRWVTIGFEVILIPAAVVGILIGLGRFRDGLALAMLCVAGTVITAAVLTEPIIKELAKGRMVSVPVSLTPGITIDLIHLGLARLGLGAILSACAPIVVLARNPGPSIRSLAVGAACAIPAIAIPALWAIPSARAALTSIHPALTGAAGILSLILFIAFFSAAVHKIIRAFEIANARATPA